MRKTLNSMVKFASTGLLALSLAGCDEQKTQIDQNSQTSPIQKEANSKFEPQTPIVDPQSPFVLNQRIVDAHNTAVSITGTRAYKLSIGDSDIKVKFDDPSAQYEGFWYTKGNFDFGWAQNDYLRVLYHNVEIMDTNVLAQARQYGRLVLEGIIHDGKKRKANIESNNAKIKKDMPKIVESAKREFGKFIKDDSKSVTKEQASTFNMVEKTAQAYKGAMEVYGTRSYKITNSTPVNVHFSTWGYMMNGFWYTKGDFDVVMLNDNSVRAFYRNNEISDTKVLNLAGQYGQIVLNDVIADSKVQMSNANSRNAEIKNNMSKLIESAKRELSQYILEAEEDVK